MGKKDIPGHFKNIYSGLYNSVDDAENMTSLSVEVEEKVGDYSLEDVSKVTPRIVNYYGELRNKILWAGHEI